MKRATRTCGVRFASARRAGALAKAGQGPRHGGRRPQARQVISEIQRDAAIPFAQRLDADPDDFAGSHQRVEHRRLIVLDSRRQDFALEHGRRDCRALQLFDGVEQWLEAMATPSSRLAWCLTRATRR